MVDDSTVISASIAIADAELTILHANDRYAALLGRTVAEVEGHSAAEWIHPDDVAAALAACRYVVANHAAKSYRRRFIHTDGRILSVIGDLVPIDVGLGQTQIICCVRVLALPARKSIDGTAVEIADTIAEASKSLRDLAERVGLESLSRRLAEVSEHAEPLKAHLYFVPYRQ